MSYIDTIHCSDALTFLKELPNNSMDMVLTDPPYFYKNLDGAWSGENLNKNISNSHIVLPRGMKFDRKQGYDFQKFMDEISKEIYRVLKPGGFFLCFSSPRLYHRLVVAIEDNGFEIRDMIGWLYNKSQVKAFSQNHIIDKDKIMTNVEKSELKEKLENHRTPQLKPAFEPICIAMKPIEGRFIDNVREWGTGLMDCSQRVGDNQDKFPSNVMATNRLNPDIEKYFLVPKPSKSEKGENNTHLTVKPIELCEHLIKLFSTEESIILDCFMGSGTTAISCINTYRHFCGCDKSQEYVDIANDRIDNL